MIGVMQARLQMSEFPRVSIERRGAETGKDDFVDAVFGSDEGRCFAHGNRHRLFERITINAATDCREGDGFDAVFDSQREAVAITGSQQVRFAVIAAIPDRADRMNDEFRRQLVATRDFRFTGAATIERAAFFQQLRAGGAVYCAVNTAATEERGVGGVDDGIDLQRDDVGFDRQQFVDCPGHGVRTGLCRASVRSARNDRRPRTVRRR